MKNPESGESTAEDDYIGSDSDSAAMPDDRKQTKEYKEYPQKKRRLAILQSGVFDAEWYGKFSVIRLSLSYF